MTDARDKPISMRPSRILQRLRAGKTAVSVKLNFGAPRVAELAALCGFDGVWIDAEHVPDTLAAIENQVRAIQMHDVDAVVRVQRGSYSDLCYPLEMNAAAIMVPHVMGAADARQVARTVRFQPVGRRPVDGGNADGAYCMMPLVDYMHQANSLRLVIAQIEDPEPMAELDQIAAVEGIDMLFFGPYDFSHGLGVPGAMDDPRVVDARKRIADAARRHGKFAGTVGSPDTFADLVALGYQFVNLGSDVTSLSAAFRAMMTAIGR